MKQGCLVTNHGSLQQLQYHDGTEGLAPVMVVQSAVGVWLFLVGVCLFLVGVCLFLVGVSLFPVGLCQVLVGVCLFLVGVSRFRDPVT